MFCQFDWRQEHYPHYFSPAPGLELPGATSACLVNERDLPVDAAFQPSSSAHRRWPAQLSQMRPSVKGPPNPARAQRQSKRGTKKGKKILSYRSVMVYTCWRFYNMDQPQTVLTDSVIPADELKNLPADGITGSVLHASLEAAFSKGEFVATDFFQSWFRKHGSAFLFVFKKNLKVTNMQIAELHALLRLHLKRSSTGEYVRDFQAMSAREFRNSVQSIIESFRQYPREDAFQLVTGLYNSLLRDIVVLEVFFGSCALFLPFDLEIDLAAVCGESGYIHSCGSSLLNRNISKATEKELFEVFESYLSTRDGLLAPPRFIVYAHEEFTDLDRPYAAALRDGLDDLKIYIDKYYVGNQSLVSVLKDMRSKKQFVGRLEIPEPGHYEKSLNDDTAVVHTVGERPTIWLVVDHKPGPDIRHKADPQYFLLYEQHYINENPLFIFDENKPAWIDHTTIPHTLVASMINVTRPWWHDPDDVCIGDPFVGTGTTWLESLRYNARAICLDNEPVAAQLLEDNLRFFCLPDNEIKRLREMLEAASKVDPAAKIFRTSSASPRYRRREPSSIEEDFFWALDRYEEACPDQHSPIADITQKLAEELGAEQRFDRRLLFYVAMRTHRRNLPAFERDAEDWGKAFQREASRLIGQMDDLLKWHRRYADRGYPLNDTRFAVFPGKYSPACCVDLSAHLAAKERPIAETITILDARLIPPKSCDVIITDPPYGLNAEYPRWMLARLYQDILMVMVEALKPEGQLIFAVPDWVHTGRQVPFFMTKEFITEQVLAAAEEKHKEVVQSANAGPQPSGAFRPPFYWESERALRRAILQFRIRDVQPTRISTDQNDRRANHGGHRKMVPN